MAATIMLIAAFQCYWITRLYKEERDNLRKETDVLFREVLYKLQLQRLKSDTNYTKHGLPDNLFAFDVMNELRQRRINGPGPGNRKGDTMEKKLVISMNVRTPGEEPGFFPGTDSFNMPVLPPGPPRVVTFINKGGGLIDSLPLSVIDSAYKAELARNSISLSYGIRCIAARPEQAAMPRLRRDELKTSFIFVGLNRSYAYQAEFDNPFSYIIRKLSWPIVVSVLLVLLTLVSFVFLYRNLREQQRLSAVKNEFISNITHELKTPIATVNVAVEALRSFNALDDPAKTKEYLDISAAELQRLSLLVEKVLRLSMFETRETELNKETFDLKTLTEDVMAVMRLQFEKQGATVSLVTEGDNFTILADRTHMTSVLYNLLDNALKYKRDNPQIDIFLKSHSMHVEVKVKDNGIGIAPEYKSRVFEKFFRVPSDNVHNTKGYGLGLSYVSHILKRHMGFIELESQPGIGSVFTAHIPYREADVIYFDDKRRAFKETISLRRKKQ